MRKILIGLTVVLIVIGVAGFLIIRGIGAKDLGIRVTPEQAKSARDKVGIEIITVGQGEGKSDYTLEGSKAAEFSMDSQELSAHSNFRPWKNYPLKNVQIKIHDDGTVEGTGVVVISKIMPYAMGLGYSESQIRSAMDKYKIPPLETTAYVKGKASIVNDQVRIEATDVKVGAIPIPATIVSTANREAEKVVEDIIHKHADNFHAESLTFENGKMVFNGKIPEKEYVWRD